MGASRDDRERAERRRSLKEAVLEVLTSKEYPAREAGEVLVSLGAAMLKAVELTESEFLKYAKAVYAAQSSLGVVQKN